MFFLLIYQISHLLSIQQVRFHCLYNHFNVLSSLILDSEMCLTMLIEGSILTLVGGIVLGVIGIVLCSVNYLIYKKMVEKKTKAVLPIIDDNKEKLANILEKGNEFLSTDII